MNNETTIPAFVIKATYQLHADDVAAYKPIMVRLAKEAKEHAGCLFLETVQNLSDPTLFHLIEGWASQETFAAFSESDEFKALLQEAMALRILDRSASRYFVSNAEDLPMPS